MRPLLSLRAKAPRVQGLHYDAGFLSRVDRAEILSFISTLQPIWENRYSDFRPLPEGEEQRRLLRPVYWLGNWQFACLDYYRPPIGLTDRCVQAEPFPPVLAKLVANIEQRSRRMFRGEEMPEKWHLNTCLVNFYGSTLKDGKWVDTARVGEEIAVEQHEDCRQDTKRRPQYMAFAAPQHQRASREDRRIIPDAYHQQPNADDSCQK